MKPLKECRLVFMGTPDFAVAVLAQLVDEGCNIVAVITAPDKPAGRGMQLTPSAVKKFAVEKGLAVLQPEKLKDPVFLDQLRTLQADIQVVVAFRMLPEVVWNMPPLGTINLHGSLLPRYRGAAPINWAIINGEKETGITTFKLQHVIDTGDILLQEKMIIREDETAGELHDEMKALGASLVYDTLEKYCAGQLIPVPQSESEDPSTIPAAPKIHTATCRINWEIDVDSIYNLIRGLSPYPGAFTEWEGKILKIFKVTKVLDVHRQRPGSWQTDGKTFFRFAALNGWIVINNMQLEGKKRMPVEDFLRGHRFNG